MGIPHNDGKRDAHNPFTFMIEEVREDGSIKRQLGGCDNVYGAQAMFRALPRYFAESDLIRLRQGARIMETINGTGEDWRAHMERTHGPTTSLLKFERDSG